MEALWGVDQACRLKRLGDRMETRPFLWGNLPMSMSTVLYLWDKFPLTDLKSPAKGRRSGGERSGRLAGPGPGDLGSAPTCPSRRPALPSGASPAFSPAAGQACFPHGPPLVTVTAPTPPLGPSRADTNLPVFSPLLHWLTHLFPAELPPVRLVCRHLLGNRARAKCSLVTNKGGSL